MEKDMNKLETLEPAATFGYGYGGLGYGGSYGYPSYYGSSYYYPSSKYYSSGYGSSYGSGYSGYGSYYPSKYYSHYWWANIVQFDCITNQRESRIKTIFP